MSSGARVEDGRRVREALDRRVQEPVSGLIALCPQRVCLVDGLLSQQRLVARTREGTHPTLFSYGMIATPCGDPPLLAQDLRMVRGDECAVVEHDLCDNEVAQLPNA